MEAFTPFYLKALNDVIFDAPEAGDVLSKDGVAAGTCRLPHPCRGCRH